MTGRFLGKNGQSFYSFIQKKLIH